MAASFSTHPGATSRNARWEPRTTIVQPSASASPRRISSCWQRLLILLVVLLPALGGTSVASASEREDRQIERARELFQLMVEGQFELLLGDAHPEIRKALTSAKMTQQWAGITMKLGLYEKVESTKLTSMGEMDSVALVAQFQRGTLELRIVLSKAGQLSGLWFDKVATDYEPPDYVDQSKFDEEEVTVSAGSFELPGTLSIPKTKGPHPAVVLVHGSGPNDRNGSVGGCRPLQDIAWGLASQGVAVLRYDKRTLAHPYACAPADWTMENEVTDDALAAVKLLREHKAVDDNRIFVAGHSLGGFAAPLIGTRDKKIAGLILLAGPARSIVDLIEEQLKKQLEWAGTNITAAQRAEVEKIFKNLELIRQGKADEVEGLILNMPAKYMASFHKIDAVKAAAKLEMPMFILQGKRDYQVTTEDFELWKEGLAKRDNVTCKLYPRLNHLFVKGWMPSTPAEYAKPGQVEQEVIDDLAEWIAKH
jgi:dienelactone hydrolase